MKYQCNLRLYLIHILFTINVSYVHSIIIMMSILFIISIRIRLSKTYAKPDETTSKPGLSWANQYTVCGYPHYDGPYGTD